MDFHEISELCDDVVSFSNVTCAISHQKNAEPDQNNTNVIILQYSLDELNSGIELSENLLDDYESDSDDNPLTDAEKEQLYRDLFDKMNMSYTNSKMIEQRILYLMKNYDHNEQTLANEISNQFNITFEQSVGEIEKVKNKKSNNSNND